MAAHGNTRNAVPLDDDTDATAERMHRYWVNFARTGDPNGEGLAEWSPFRPDAEHTIVFQRGNEDTVVRDFRGSQLDFVEERGEDLAKRRPWAY